jgi:hypothetical protein
VFGGDAQRSHLLTFLFSAPQGPSQVIFKYGETDMGDKGSKDKGKREQKKKAQHSPQEKRKLKREKNK